MSQLLMAAFVPRLRKGCSHCMHVMQTALACGSEQCLNAPNQQNRIPARCLHNRLGSILWADLTEALSDASGGLM